jgi:hypothetical protein
LEERRSSSSCFWETTIASPFPNQKKPMFIPFTQRNWSQNTFSLSECLMLVVNKTSLLHEFAWSSFLWVSLTSLGQVGKFYFPSQQGVGFFWGGVADQSKSPISKEKRCFNCRPPPPHQLSFNRNHLHLHKYCSGFRVS